MSFWNEVHNKFHYFICRTSTRQLQNWGHGTIIKLPLHSPQAEASKCIVMCPIEELAESSVAISHWTLAVAPSGPPHPNDPNEFKKLVSKVKWRKQKVALRFNCLSGMRGRIAWVGWNNILIIGSLELKFVGGRRTLEVQLWVISS
jgi:hypothetical protein